MTGYERLGISGGKDRGFYSPNYCPLPTLPHLSFLAYWGASPVVLLSAQRGETLPDVNSGMVAQ